MKIVLAVLIFGFFVNLTSGFLWFNYRTNPQLKETTISQVQQGNQLQNSVYSSRQALIASNKDNVNRSPLQRVANRFQYQVHNTTVAQRQVDNINKNSSQIIPHNRFAAILYQQQQHRVLNHFAASRPTNRTTSQQIVRPRFRSFLLPIRKTNITIVSAANHPAFPSTPLSKVIVADSKPHNSSIVKNNIQRFPALLRALTTKTANINSQNRQRLLAAYYLQEHIKEFYRRLNEQNAAYNQYKINSALKRLNGANQPKDYYPMTPDSPNEER